MPHYGTLAGYRFSTDADDIRGAALYGVGSRKLGKIDDVIFDHSTGNITYVIVDTGGWLRSKKFVVPAERIHPFDKDRNAFQIGLRKAHIEHFPPFDAKTVISDRDWTEYDERCRRAWNDSVVQHRKDSDQNITLPAGDLSLGRGSLGEDVTSDFSGARSLDPGTGAPPPKGPGRGSLGEEVLTETALDETAESGGFAPEPFSTESQKLSRGERWDRFEELLRRNHVDITAKCPSCQAAKDRAA